MIKTCICCDGTGKLGYPRREKEKDSNIWIPTREFTCEWCHGRGEWEDKRPYSYLRHAEINKKKH